MTTLVCFKTKPRYSTEKLLNCDMHNIIGDDTLTKGIKIKPRQMRILMQLKSKIIFQYKIITFGLLGQ